MSPALTQALLPPEQAARLILADRPCVIAGEEALLRQLPRGPWIGGTTPYFMAEHGGTCERERVFVTELPRHGPTPQIRNYDLARLDQVCTDGPDHGLSVLLLPAFSAVHQAFAQQAPDFPDMYLKPLVGWIAGTHLEAGAGQSPKVVDGLRGLWHTDAGVALHLDLPESLLVQVDILNLFEPGPGPVIEFDQGGFSARHCRIDGRDTLLHDWMLRTQIDPRWPLVADYHGARINVSIKALDAAAGTVEFYAPVFAGVRYRLARPIMDYSAAFAAAAAGRHQAPLFSCNCILNYLHGDLQGRHTGPYQGPMSFGEIGYQLLNQTLVHLSLQPA